MDEERFKTLVAAYGAEAARWPDAERLVALRYLAATPAAHSVRAEGRRLDEWLDAWRLPPPSASLAASAVAGARKVRLLRPRTLWLSAGGLAAASLVGLLVGTDLSRAAMSTQPAGDPAVTAALNGASEFTPNIDPDAG